MTTEGGNILNPIADGVNHVVGGNDVVQAALESVDSEFAFCQILKSNGHARCFAWPLRFRLLIS